jgi:hypothetical protein
MLIFIYITATFWSLFNGLYWLIPINVIKTKKYHNVGTIPKSNMKIVEKGTIETPYTQVHDRDPIHTSTW